MEIDWIDGHKSAWSFALAALGCPCATCVEERKAEGRKAGQANPSPPFSCPCTPRQ